MKNFIYGVLCLSVCVVGLDYLKPKNNPVWCTIAFDAGKGETVNLTGRCVNE
jgi:hypothetical protein